MRKRRDLDVSYTVREGQIYSNLEPKDHSPQPQIIPRSPHQAGTLYDTKTTSAVQVCGNSSWLIPLGLSLPYAWRFCQCLRVYKDTGAVPQLFNALKYSTAFPVTAFSYMKYHTDEASWASVYRPLWILAALLNSSYSYFWDVERDWEIQWFTAPASGEYPLYCHTHLCGGGTGIVLVTLGSGHCGH